MAELAGGSMGEDQFTQCFGAGITEMHGSFMGTVSGKDHKSNDVLYLQLLITS